MACIIVSVGAYNVQVSASNTQCEGKIVDHVIHCTLALEELSVLVVNISKAVSDARFPIILLLVPGAKFVPVRATVVVELQTSS
jgi:hypothetical protein